jgi:hypothetical protein
MVILNYYKKMKLNYLNWLLLLVVVSACEKENGNDLSDFDVKTEALTFKAGEEVTFKLNGNSPQLTFYSGEALKDYNFKDGRIVEAGSLKMSFSSRTQYGAQDNQFSIMASTDFNGQYNIDDIKAASWTDITNRFTIGTDVNFIGSGIADLDDLTIEGKPIYFVLKYVHRTSAGLGRSWYVQNFTLLSQTAELGLSTLESQNSLSWQLIYFGPKEATGRSSVSATTILLRANAVNQNVYTEDWCISKPVYISSIDLGPDRGVPIKGFSDKPLTEYKYIYGTPGNYKATFVAANKTADHNEELVKEIEITINP